MSAVRRTVHGMPMEPLPRIDVPNAPGPLWARLVGVFDLETTGVDVQADRIVTAHVGVLDGAGRVIRAKDWLADPGVAIPEAATRIHGVTTGRAQAQGRPAALVVAEVVDALAAVFAAGLPVVAYNAAYDFSLLRHEAERHGVVPLAEPGPVVDPLIVDKRYDRWRPGTRTLGAVAAHYAVELEGAHEAAADAVAAGRVAQALAARFAPWLPETAVELHTRQIGWARAQAASLTDYFVRIGRIDGGTRLDGRWPVRGDPSTG